MAFPKLTKSEALRLECVRIAGNANGVNGADALYKFIIGNESAEKIKMIPKKRMAKK